MRQAIFVAILLLGWGQVSPVYAFSLRPAIIDIEAAPGGEVRRRVELRNDRATPMTVYSTIQGVDPQDDGSGIEFLDPSVAEAGKWIFSTGKEWVLGAGEVRSVDFLLRVPTNTKPGFYPVSVAFSEFYPANSSVSQAVRIASLWFINVKNKSTVSTEQDQGGLSIKGARLVHERGDLLLEAIVGNQTHFSRRLSGTLFIRRNADEESRSVDELNIRVLPESERQLRIPIGPASLGRHTVRLQIDGATPEYVSRWIIPKVLIGGLGALVVFVGAWFVSRKKK